MGFFSVKFLMFVFFMWIGLEIASGICYLFLKYVKKDNNIKGVKFKFLNRWLDDYYV